MPEFKRVNCYQLPDEAIFCKRCVNSNQTPTSVPEFKHIIGQKKPTLAFDEEGVCDACRYTEIKRTKINWDERERELLELLDRYRRRDGYYDVVVPGSGGKDSVRVSHVLKYKYGMHPLTVTWPPHLYTEIGWKNFRRWIDVGGFDNITFNPNGRVHRLLTKLAVENIFHPFQPFTLGQKYLAPKVAMKFGIELVFYAENPAEYFNPISDNLIPEQDMWYYAADTRDLSDIYLGGVSADRLIREHGLSLGDLEAYLPPFKEELLRAKIDVCFLGYYLKWVPQENYYYAVEHTGFEANPERTEGTFTKFSSLDDRIDGLHYWAHFIKFGMGRATHDASHLIRTGEITREEAVGLVRRYDGEFPKKYFKEILEYIDMDEEKFFELADKFRPPHLWERVNGRWRLKKQLS